MRILLAVTQTVQVQHLDMNALMKDCTAILHAMESVVMRSERKTKLVTMEDLERHQGVKRIALQLSMDGHAKTLPKMKTLLLILIVSQYAETANY